MKILAYQNKNGEVLVVYPSPKEHIEKHLGKLTDEQYWGIVKEKSIPLEANYIELDSKDLPRTKYRNAWIISSNKIGYDLQKIKDIKISELKKIKEANLSKPTPQTIEAYSSNPTLANRSFTLTSEHIAKFKDIIDDLQFRKDNGEINPTRNWTDDSGERVPLSISDYRSLRSHFNFRDEQENNLYNIREKAIKSFSTLEELEAYDLNEVGVQEEKDYKLSYLNNKRNQLIQNPIRISILLNGITNVFLYEIKDLKDLLTKKSSIESGNTEVVKNLDNLEIEISSNNIDGLITALQQYNQDIEEFYNENLSILESLTTLEQVQNFNPIF